MIDTLVNYHTRDRWLAARAQGIGASDVSALFGLSPWASAFSLWSERTGLAEPTEPDAEWIHWGNLLEEPIARRYQEVTGRRVWHGGSFCIATHQRLPMLRCTPDRLVESAIDIGHHGPGNLQIKNAAWFKEADWEDGPPPHIAIQVQAELACLDAQWASVAVLIGGNRFRYFDVERNPAVIEEIEEQVAWFWGLVTSRTPPEIDGSEATARILKRLHPNDDGRTVDLPSEAIEFVDKLIAGRAEVAAAERAGKELKAGPENYLRALIGGATFGRLPDGRIVSLKTQTRTTQANVSTFRTLKLEKGTP